MVTIAQVRSREDLEIARTLFTEYANSIGFSLAFQDFRRELEALPGDYGPPTGRLMLAWSGSEAAGCVALRKLSSDVCEMKRLFVRPAFRGKGIGRALALEAIEIARSLGYARMRLDTVPSMNRAIELYRTLGFSEIEPYRYNPIPRAKFLEMKLR